MSVLDASSIRDYQWLFLDLNSYFASVEQQLCPDLRGRPIAVIPLETEATCAIAASYEAKAYGIKTGTKVYDAKRLCPNITFVLARHDVYVDYHHRIMEELERHIPIHSIESIDEAACRLTANQCNEQIATALAKQIKADIKTNIGEAIGCSIGIAPNKYLAKVASDLQKPDGLTILKKTTIFDQIKHLYPRDLTGIGFGMTKRLERAGINTIEQLWSRSPKELRHIWGGVGGERFWYKLHGHNLPDRETKKRTVGHSHMLAPEMRPPTQAYIVAQRLLLKAASRLRRLGYVAQAMDLSIRIENGPRLHIDKQFYRAQDSVTLKAIMSESWKKLMTENVDHNPVKKISITLHNLIPHQQVQPGLFDSPDDSSLRYSKLCDAMDSLNNKYGRDTVVMGFSPQQSKGFSGTKIAFSRIPDLQEFHE